MSDTQETTLDALTPGADAIKEIARLALNSEAILSLPPKANDGQPIKPLALVREGFQIKDLSHHLQPTPNALARLQDVDSFIQYVNRYSTADTLLGVEPESAQFTATFDYHAEPPQDRGSLTAAARASMCRPRDHTATLTLIKSPELREWEKAFGKWHAQEDLAEWLEDHAHQVTDPGHADILTIARELSINSDVTYTKAQRANDGGYDFQYKEDTTGAAGELSIPGKITINIPLYLGDVATPIESLLRYRLRDGAAVFYIRPLRLEEMLRYAIEQIRAKITQETKHYIHVGTL